MENLDHLAMEYPDAFLMAALSVISARYKSLMDSQPNSEKTQMAKHIWLQVNWAHRWHLEHNGTFGYSASDIRNLSRLIRKDYYDSMVAIEKSLRHHGDVPAAKEIRIIVSNLGSDVAKVFGKLAQRHHVIPSQGSRRGPQKQQYS